MTASSTAAALLSRSDRRRFAEQRIPIENTAELAESGAYGQQSRGVALGTVRRFQGGERSIVLFSSVVTHLRRPRGS